MSHMSSMESKPIQKRFHYYEIPTPSGTIKSGATARQYSVIRVADACRWKCISIILHLMHSRPRSSLPIHPLRFDRGPCTHNMCRRVAWIIRRLCASYYAFPVLIGVHYATTKVNEFAVFCCRVYVLGSASHKANRWNLAFPLAQCSPRSDICKDRSYGCAL